MIPSFFLIVLSTGFQPVQHRWAPLVLTSSERIEIDTASIQVIGASVRRVWLRWDLNAGLARYQPQYDLELRDLDCASGRTRTIEKRHEGPAGPTMMPPTRIKTEAEESLSATEASWQTPLHGSLLAQVFDAGCRFTKAGA